jgi:hypothetical protein
MSSARALGSVTGGKCGRALDDLRQKQRHGGRQRQASLVKPKQSLSNGGPSVSSQSVNTSLGTGSLLYSRMLNSHYQPFVVSSIIMTGRVQNGTIETIVPESKFWGFFLALCCIGQSIEMLLC